MEILCNGFLQSISLYWPLPPLSIRTVVYIGSFSLPLKAQTCRASSRIIASAARAEPETKCNGEGAPGLRGRRAGRKREMRRRSTIWSRFGSRTFPDGALAIRGSQTRDEGDGEGWAGGVTGPAGRKSRDVVTSVTSGGIGEGEAGTPRAGDARQRRQRHRERHSGRRFGCSAASQAESRSRRRRAAAAMAKQAE